MSYLDHTNAVDLYPYRTALRRYGLASIATHQYPTDAAALEQEAAARALVELIEAATRRQVAEELRATFAANARGELDRPKVERGGFLNDREWAAAIAHGRGETDTKEQK